MRVLLVAIVASARIRRDVHKLPGAQNEWDDNTHTHSDSPPIEHVTWYVLRLPPMNTTDAINNTDTLSEHNNHMVVEIDRRMYFRMLIFPFTVYSMIYFFSF